MLGRSSGLLGLSLLAAAANLQAHMPGMKTRARHAASGSRPVPRKKSWYLRSPDHTWHDPARVAAAQAKRERKAAKCASDRLRTVDAYKTHRAATVASKPIGDRNAYEVH